jgi:lipopolysaccharide/colanic/teichoic acid biosynthesis glycosyltransferase
LSGLAPPANIARVSSEVARGRAELLAVKYALDPILAGVLIALLLPVFALTALTVLIAMGRPIFFVQTRAGLHGRPFSMLKFRSMVAGSLVEGPASKREHDPRVTPLGKVLRRTSLDELPQLVNVLLGSMSLVGPRPLALEEQRKFRVWHPRRLAMKPGITGLPQVSGRSLLELEAWVELDLEYVDRWSPQLDLSILLRTIAVVLSCRGAH